MDNSLQALNKASGGKKTSSLLNIMMELKKCCNHLYLFNGLRETITGQNQFVEVECRKRVYSFHHTSRALLAGGPDDEGSEAWHMIRSSGASIFV